MVGTVQLRTRRRRRNGPGRSRRLVNSDALADGAASDEPAAEANWAHTHQMATVERRAGGTRSQEGGQLAAGTDRAAGVVRREDGRGTSWAAGTEFTAAQSRAASTGA